MADNEVIMKGNEALAEAAIRSGCRFFSGYPITPQTEILEYMSWRMEEAGGEAIQTEDELCGAYMLFGAAAAGARALSTSAGPGFSLYQEAISYLVGSDLPAVLVDVSRIGNALGDISQSQGDYELIRKGNGHGDTMVIALTPASVQEIVDDVQLAYELAEKYLHPVIILYDAAIGQMMEGVTLPEMSEHDINKFDWSVKGVKKGEHGRKITNVSYFCDDMYVGYEKYLRDKYQAITDNEQRWENVEVADAEVVCVAYGISSRVCKEAVRNARAEGIKLGLIRLKTITPFPVKAFEEIGPDCKGIEIVEMSIKGQMIDDVALATKCNIPLYGYLTSYLVPDSEKVIEVAKDILAGKAEEVL
jgi:Pyruvate:ferredoxin oxidoreductase and related 2-oxoacid:ferredoxin oxidoreductases, alpha subunit